MRLENLKPGIQSNSLIKDSVILPNVRVYNNTIISNAYIGSGAVVMGCGSIYFIDSNPLSTYLNIEPGSKSRR